MCTNKLFDFKIRELKALNKKFDVVDDILVIYERQPIMIGCRLCYMVKPIRFEINGQKLINCYEKFGNKCGLPTEIAINAWLCPKCFRLCRELLPQIVYVGINR